MTALPEFDTPPVIEVALGVQFRSLSVLRGLALAPLREQWRDRYPRVQEQPSLPSFVEPAELGTPVIQVNLASPSTRYWFLSDDETELVQVQHDRLSVNWRQGQTGASYPRYRLLRSAFQDRFADVAAFTHEAGEGVSVTQAELSYVNALNVEPTEMGRLEQFLRVWRGMNDHHLGAPERAQVELAFRVPSLGAGPSRLYAQVGQGMLPAGKPALFLTLSVRGAPRGEGIDEALEFMDDAHEHAVRSFAELTAEPMHAVWGRADEHPR